MTRSPCPHPKSCCLFLPLETFPGGSDSKEAACSAADGGSIPGSGRSPGGGHGNPLQYSCLENSMDRGAWQATVRGVEKSWHDLSDWHFHFVELHSPLLQFGSQRGLHSVNYVCVYLEISFKMIQMNLQNRNRLTNPENKPPVARGKDAGKGQFGSLG